MLSIRKMLVTVVLGGVWLVSYGQDAPVGTSAVLRSDQDSRGIAASVLERLDAAWNAADGKAFAAEFADDADVINIFGGVFRGRPAIEQRIQAIFDTIFKGSVHRARELETARFLAPGVVLAVSSARIEVPTGPLAPEARNRQTFILVNTRGTWKISHWQNTPIQQANGAR